MCVLLFNLYDQFHIDYIKILLIIFFKLIIFFITYTYDKFMYGTTRKNYIEISKPTEIY